VLDPYDEICLVNELNLRNFKQKSAGYNFSCPICGEGKSPHKTRAWILFAGTSHDHNTFMCHNHLPEGMSVKNFIKEVDPYVYEKYKELEKNQYIKDIQSGKIFNKRTTGVSFKGNLNEKPKYIFKLNPKTFIPCNVVPGAVAYCKSRKIPQSIIDTLYYCPRKDLPYGGMVIFPLRFNEKEIYGFQGRAIKEKRFSTFMPNDNYKVYNLFNVDRTANVYVFESIIDSFVIPNSISMLGSDLSQPVRKTLKRPIFVFDNDRTGEEKTLKYMLRGEKCFIWPDEIGAKDFGELTEKNILNEQLRKLIKSRIFTGLQGEIEIKLKLAKSKKTFRKVRRTYAQV